MEHIVTAPPVGLAIEASLIEAGMSQRALAEVTGIPLVTLNRSINGHRPLNLDELARIADALGTSLSALVAASESRTTADLAS